MILNNKIFYLFLKKNLLIFTETNPNLDLTKKAEELSLNRRKKFMNEIFDKKFKTKLNNEYLLLINNLEIPSLIKKQFEESVKFLF